MRLAMEAAIEAACSFASVALRPSGIPPYLVRVRGRVGARVRARVRAKALGHPSVPG